MKVIREIWDHPLNLECEKKGEFCSLYPDFHNFQKEFSKKLFDHFKIVSASHIS